MAGVSDNTPLTPAAARPRSCTWWRLCGWSATTARSQNKNSSTRQRQTSTDADDLIGEIWYKKNLSSTFVITNKSRDNYLTILFVIWYVVVNYWLLYFIYIFQMTLSNCVFYSSKYVNPKPWLTDQQVETYQVRNFPQTDWTGNYHVRVFFQLVLSNKTMRDNDCCNKTDNDTAFFFFFKCYL